MNKTTLPISMKKQDMIEEYETLYHNYKGKEQTINIQSTYIEILMNMLLKQGVSQEEINETLDGNKVACRIEVLKKERIHSNILNEQLKIKEHDVKLLENKIKRLESRDRPRKVLCIKDENLEKYGGNPLYGTFIIGSCPNCGLDVQLGMKYCPLCGQRLNWEDAKDE